MLAVFGASIFVAYRAASVGASANARFTIGVLAGAVAFHLVSCDWSPYRSRHGISAPVHGLVSIAPGASRNFQP